MLQGQKLSREMNGSYGLVMALKDEIRYRHSYKSHTAEKKRQHGEINCSHNSRANQGADGHARIGGHVLDAICRP